MVSTSGLWPSLLATWLSITPVPATAPEPGAGAAPRDARGQPSRQAGLSFPTKPPDKGA